MARLSNFIASSKREESSAPIVCRPADRARGEIEAGLRLILGGPSGPANDVLVLDFLSLAVQRRIDVNLTWIAESGGKVIWAVLPVPSPGRTMLLLTPGRLSRASAARSVGMLADTVCEHFVTQHTELAQVLLDPHDRKVQGLYRDAGFAELAELVYLQRTTERFSAAPAPPQTGSLSTYSAQTHATFADVIQRSYVGSLDCPGINGRREIEDVIAGHQATGHFDPSMWFVLVHEGVGRGVLLLNPTVMGDGVELVYLGVTPEARGHAVGDYLMRLATAETVRRGFAGLSLAVDSRNRPALSLYFRHGMKKVGARSALLRDLRPLA